jgi:hypothetical protein
MKKNKKVGLMETGASLKATFREIQTLMITSIPKIRIKRKRRMTM